MALKCAKNDFKHSTVHGDRRSENILGCFIGPILDLLLNENFYRAIQTFWLYFDRESHQWL